MAKPLMTRGVSTTLAFHARPDQQEDSSTVIMDSLGQLFSII